MLGLQILPSAWRFLPHERYALPHRLSKGTQTWLDSQTSSRLPSSPLHPRKSRSCPQRNQDLPQGPHLLRHLSRQLQVDCLGFQTRGQEGTSMFASQWYFQSSRILSSSAPLTHSIIPQALSQHHYGTVKSHASRACSPSRTSFISSNTITGARPTTQQPQTWKHFVWSHSEVRLSSPHVPIQSP